MGYITKIARGSGDNKLVTVVPDSGFFKRHQDKLGLELYKVSRLYKLVSLDHYARRKTKTHEMIYMDKVKNFKAMPLTAQMMRYSEIIRLMRSSTDHRPSNLEQGEISTLHVVHKDDKTVSPRIYVSYKYSCGLAVPIGFDELTMIGCRDPRKQYKLVKSDTRKEQMLERFVSTLPTGIYEKWPKLKEFGKENHIDIIMTVGGLDIVTIDSTTSKLLIRAVSNPAKKSNPYQPLIKAILAKKKSVAVELPDGFIKRKVMVVFNPDAMDDIIQYTMDRAFGKEKIQKELNKIKGISKTNNAMLNMKGFTGTPQEHQVHGINWLTDIYKSGFPGAILADDMGMGKTFQTIGFLSNIRTTRILIIAPATVVGVWQNELKKWNPGMRNYKIMSYEMYLRRKTELTKYKYDVVVCDEVQKMKNKSAQITGAIMALKSNFKLLLSGTVIENKVDDLTTLIEIVNPASVQLSSLVSNLVKKEPTRHAKITFQIYNDMILRRLKTSKQLTSKMSVETLELSPSKCEQELNDQITKYYQEMLKEEDSTMVMLTGIMRLRQAVSAPLGLPDELRPDCVNTKMPTKFAESQKIIAKNSAKKEATVVFTQFKSTIQLFKSRYPNALYIDGSLSSTKKRNIVSEFQNGKSMLIVVSLKSGNSGITLTKANHLIMYDLWWNPAVEAQALARIHRIGQQKNVFIYRLAIKGSIDDTINEINIHKKSISAVQDSEEVTNTSDMDKLWNKFI